MQKFNSNLKRLFLFVVIICLITSFLNIQIIAKDTDLKPDLIISTLDAPEDFIEDKNIKIIVKIKNQGEKNITSGSEIKVGLFLNNTLLAYNTTTEGLLIKEYIFVNLSWTPNFIDENKHMFSVIVNYDTSIYESDYNNNVWDFYRTIHEKDTDLEFIDVDFPNIFRLNEKLTIVANIRNNGRNTNSTVSVDLRSSIEGLIDTVSNDTVIKRNESLKFYFNWTPSDFGLHEITLKIKFRDKTHDTFSKIVTVGFQNFKWWNSSWHYRHFLSTKSKGVVSYRLNFTKFLKDIGIVSQQLENDTLRVVLYSENGKIKKVVDDFWFNERSDFDPVSNADGTLIWDFGSTSSLKYYCVYFDVSANPGFRTSIIDDESLIVSKNIDDVLNFTDGWWLNLNSPKNDSFTFISNAINISVSTSSIAENVTAFVFLDENTSHNFTLYLSNVYSGIDWISEDFNFDSEGNWTIRIKGYDKAGYAPQIFQQNLFVGRPDFNLLNISFFNIYENQPINITATVYCKNATVSDVPVAIIINKTSDGSGVYNNSFLVNLSKNQNNTINFIWKPNQTGEYIVEIIVDPENIFNETNESNNKLSKKLVITEAPVLEIEEIFLPSFDIYEFGRVKIDVKIRNTADTDADDYEIGLFIEPDSQEFMRYSFKRDKKKISIDKNSAVKTSLYWNNSMAGRWLVGVQVLYDESNRPPDMFNTNYRLLCENILIVKSYEENKPIFKDIIIDKVDSGQGEIVTIKANITDDSGIKIVNITIINPQDNKTTASMVRSTGYTYIYEYSDTLEIGTYVFEIFVVDISYYENNETEAGIFTIKKDTTVPVISYFGADPSVQVKDEPLDIVCVASDNIGIEIIEITILSPNGSVIHETLTEQTKRKYVYENIYKDIGEYEYYLDVIDKASNSIHSKTKTFWITTDVNDTDNDGMPDWWEKRYGFDPKNPDDKDEDYDKDGITNLEEFKGDITPIQDIFMQNMGYRIKSNLGYLAISLVFLFLMLFLSLYAKRKRF